MELKDFVARQVIPGEPLTAQAWNELVEGLSSVYQYLQATRDVVKVQITNTDLDPKQVRVAATRADAPPVEAVRPVQAGDLHVLSGLETGSYTVQAEADGWKTAQKTVEVGAGPAPVVTFALERIRVAAPRVFGVELRAALSTLGAAGIPVTRVVDVAGKDQPPANPDADARTSLVLLQLPDAGELVDPAVGIQLVIAGKLEPDSVIMPNLDGKTLGQARKILEDLGLVLGTTETLNP